MPVASYLMRKEESKGNCSLSKKKNVYLNLPVVCIMDLAPLAKGLKGKGKGNQKWIDPIPSPTLIPILGPHTHQR